MCLKNCHFQNIQLALDLYLEKIELVADLHFVQQDLKLIDWGRGGELGPIQSFIYPKF